MKYLLFLSVVVLFLCSGCVSSSQPLLKIAVIGDPQCIPSEHHWGMVNTAKAFKYLAGFEPDVLIMTGDLADSGYPEVFDIYMDMYRKNFSGKLPVQVACAGNHDFDSRPKRTTKSYWQAFHTGLQISDKNPCRQTIGGYDFITCTEEDNNDYTPEIIEKFRKLLDEAVARDNKKPIFVVTHYAPAKTVSGEHYGRGILKQLFDDYPQIVSLSGHSHIPLEDEKNIWQGNFTALASSTLSYGCVPDRALNVLNSILPYAREVQQALMINVFPDHLEIRRYHVGDNREIKPDSPWTVDIPYDPAKPRYTEKRANTATAPQFPKGAKLSFRHDYGYYYLVFDAAKHKDMVYSYHVKVLVKTSGGKWLTVREADYISDFYRYQKHQATEFAVKLPAGSILGGKVMRFEVYPVENFGKRGTPLAIELKMPQHWKSIKKATPSYPVE